MIVDINYIKKNFRVKWLYVFFQEPDETLLERLIGLTEMFPESVRNATANIFECTVKGIQGLYQATCIASWVVFTSSIVLFAPVVFETERAQMDEMQKTQAKQVLLGPGSAIAAVGNSKNDLPALR